MWIAPLAPFGLEDCVPGQGWPVILTQCSSVLVRQAENHFQLHQCISIWYSEEEYIWLGTGFGDALSDVDSISD